MKKFEGLIKSLRNTLVILWIRFWFLLIPILLIPIIMLFLLYFKEILSISDSHINYLFEGETILFLVLIAAFVFSALPENGPQEKGKEKGRKKKKKRESPKIVSIIIEIERIRDFFDYTGFSKEEYPSDYEEEYPSDYEEDDPPRYPFRDVDLNSGYIRRINGSDIQESTKNWSIGKVHYIEYDSRYEGEEYIEEELVWVWVQILLYYPMAMPSKFILPCRLSEDLRAHPISKGDFVLFEYDAIEKFHNRIFTIIYIEKEKN